MKENISARIATNIKYLGKFRRKEMRDIEPALGCSYGYISRCIKGNRHLSIDIVYKAILYFDTTFEDLIETDYKTLWEDY